MVFFDLETTGLNLSTDRIIEIALLKILPDGKEESKVMRLNPEMHIPEETSKIHGIYDADVQNAPTFKMEARNLARFIEGCDLAGFNSNKFDIPMLAEEFLRAGVDVDLKRKKFIDVQSIYHKMERRNLAAAYKFYCNKNLENAHSALADTQATYEILKAQLDCYKDADYEDADGAISQPIKNDMEALCEFSGADQFVDFAGRFVYDANGVEIFNFGRYKGQPVEQVLREQPNFYNWMLNGEFPLYTKKVLTQIKLRMR